MMLLRFLLIIVFSSVLSSAVVADPYVLLHPSRAAYTYVTRDELAAYLIGNSSKIGFKKSKFLLVIDHAGQVAFAELLNYCLGMSEYEARNEFERKLGRGHITKFTTAMDYYDAFSQIITDPKKITYGSDKQYRIAEMSGLIVVEIL